MSWGVTPVTGPAPRLWTSANKWLAPSALRLVLRQAMANCAFGAAAPAAAVVGAVAAVVAVAREASAAVAAAVAVSANVGADGWGRAVRVGVSEPLEAVVNGAARVDSPFSGWQTAADRARTATIGVIQSK